jgi:hypothetical protein
MHVPRQCFIAIHFLDYNWYLNTTGKSIRQQALGLRGEEILWLHLKEASGSKLKIYVLSSVGIYSMTRGIQFSRYDAHFRLVSRFYRSRIDL